MREAAEEKFLTAEEFSKLPDENLKQELVSGYIVSEPVPGFRHGLVLMRLGTILSEFVRSRSLGVVPGADSGFILARSPDTVRGPDVSFVTKERFEALGAIPGYFPGPPDLAAEVLSPGDRPATLRGKVADYLASGTRLVWILDPEKRRVTVHRTVLSPRTLEAEDILEGEDVLPGFRVKVSDLFEI